MAVLALVLFAVWAFQGYAVRGLVHWRRTGDAGFRVRPDGWWAALLALGGLANAVVAPIAALAGLPPIGPLDRPFLAVAGVALAGAGIVGTFVTQFAMGDSWRIGLDETERTTLVTGGPFGVTRNPIYSSMVVFAAGLALMVPNPVAVAGLAAAVLGVELQVRLAEEPYLRRVHGAAYERYAERVGRFVPGLGRLRFGAPAGSDHS